MNEPNKKSNVARKDDYYTPKVTEFMNKWDPFLDHSISPISPNTEICVVGNNGWQLIKALIECSERNSQIINMICREVLTRDELPAYPNNILDKYLHHEIPYSINNYELGTERDQNVFNMYSMEPYYISKNENDWFRGMVRNAIIATCGFTILSSVMLNSIVEAMQEISGKHWRDIKVLEVCAGSGSLAYGLTEMACLLKENYVAVDDQSNSFYINYGDPWYHVEKMDAFSAVNMYGRDIDFLIVSWPPANFSMSKLFEHLHMLNKKAKIVFIGNVDDGTCGDKRFWKLVQGCKYKTRVVFHYWDKEEIRFLEWKQYDPDYFYDDGIMSLLAAKECRANTDTNEMLKYMYPDGVIQDVDNIRKRIFFKWKRADGTDIDAGYIELRNEGYRDRIMMISAWFYNKKEHRGGDLLNREIDWLISAVHGDDNCEEAKAIGYTRDIGCIVIIVPDELDKINDRISFIYITMDIFNNSTDDVQKAIEEKEKMELLSTRPMLFKFHDDTEGETWYII